MGSIGTLIATLATAQVGETISHYKRNSVLYLFAAIFFLTAYVFFLVGMAAWLSAAYGTIEAMIFLAVGSLALGVAIIVVVMIFNARDRRLTLERRRRSQAQTSLLIATGLAVFRKQPLLMTALAAGGAALLGMNSRSGRKSDRDD